MRSTPHPALAAALAGVIGIGAPAFAAAQDPAPVPAPAAVQPDLQAEFSALQKQFQEAQQAFYGKYAACKTDEERNALFADPEQNPNRIFAPRVRAFAERAGKHDAAGDAWVFLLGIAEDPEKCKEIAARVRQDFLDSPASEGFAQWMRYGHWQIGEEPAVGHLRALDASKRPGTRAGAAFALAAILMSGDEASRKEARALFERLPKEFAGTPYAQEAEGYLYELDHLQIGMVAPEIEGTDQDGKAFKLSEYRGKVIVLDFWGFW